MHTLWNKGPIAIEPHTRKLVTILTIAIQSFRFQSLLFTHNCRIALSSDKIICKIIFFNSLLFIYRKIPLNLLPVNMNSVLNLHTTRQTFTIFF